MRISDQSICNRNSSKEFQSNEYKRRRERPCNRKWRNEQDECLESAANEEPVCDAELGTDEVLTAGTKNRMVGVAEGSGAL